MIRMICILRVARRATKFIKGNQARYLLISSLLFFFASCSKSQPTQFQTARLSLATDPTMLDPRKARDLASVNLIHMLFEGLARTSQTGKTELALAKNVKIDEKGLRYEFHLRKSLWSNGDPLTAFDFVATWKTILDPRFATDIAYQLYPIKNARKAKLGEIGVEAIGVHAFDDHTLVVELEQPIPYFLELVSTSAFYPVSSKAASLNSEWHLMPGSFVCNGPFILQSWNHADRLRLLKNDRYWEANTVKLSRIDLLIASPDTSLQMYEEGNLDWIGSPLSTIPADAIRSLTNAKRLETSLELGTAFYRINTAQFIGEKKNILADANIRRILSLALDREAIARHVLQGGQKAARSLVPPEMGLQEKEKQEIHEEKFELLEKFEEPITISYLNSERNAAVAQAVQKQWENAVGIKVQLEAVEPKVFFQRVSKKEYQIAGGSWMADFNDPVNFLEVFKYKDGSTNNTEWENTDYIDLLNRSSVCKIGEERNELLQRAQEILMEEMPIIPIYHSAQNYAKRPELTGAVLSPMGQLDLRWAFFAELPQKE